MTILVQILFSFLATAAFAILTNVPRRSLLACGLVGTAGWLAYWVCVHYGGSPAFGSLLGALAVAVFSNFASKKMKMPVTIFNIPGMVPLVPGAIAYQAIRSFVTGSYEMGMQSAVQVVMIAGAIALGLVLSEVFNHNIRSFKEKRDLVAANRQKEWLRRRKKPLK
ncbi:hypothetical protein RU97_GL001985 [Enterococcus canis]|uniref:Threonine/Serine exporter ThrE domain-containing protein n=1 Tax=Enterococcus canis TaxID=214095 RepID=A0A1L8RFQ1_9ENTE|nr:threonine/serine exporter family protein [Enterococcus canis]OJG18588.1 hypothetical protein RU97_GL001985 [Enterococcus canis]